MEILEKYYNFFKSFANSYIDNAIDKTAKVSFTRKRDHSYRVLENAVRIASSLNLDENELFLIKIMALFHDLGRFTQYEKYETFVDSKSENHANLSIKCIDDNHLLKEINKSDADLVKKCIFLHNEKDLPEEINEKTKMYANILRDADKLDFFKNMVDIVPTLLKEEQDVFYGNTIDNGEISDLVYNQIMNHQTIKNTDIKTKTEKQVRAFGFITSGIIYEESLKIIEENDYIEKIYNLIQKSNRVNDIYLDTKEYMKEKIN